MFAPQLKVADSECSISGVTEESTGTEGMIWDTVDSEDLLLATDTPPPHSEDFCSLSESRYPRLSPADQALARLNRSVSSEPKGQMETPPMDTCDLRCETDLF